MHVYDDSDGKIGLPMFFQRAVMERNEIRHRFVWQHDTKNTENPFENNDENNDYSMENVGQPSVGFVQEF